MWGNVSELNVDTTNNLLLILVYLMKIVSVRQ